MDVISLKSRRPAWTFATRKYGLTSSKEDLLEFFVIPPVTLPVSASAASTSTEIPVNLPDRAEARTHCRKRLTRAGMASMRALRVLTWASNSSSFCAMRFCSAAGGTGKMSSLSLPRAIRFLVVPDAFREISSRIGEALMACISHLWEISACPDLKTATSTTVRHLCGKFGIKHARPSGSGMRAIRTSPSSSAVQFKRSKVSSLTKRDDLLMKVPSPISASCRSLFCPSGS